MARRVFFSFHYGRDIMRANVVRQSWLTHPSAEVAGFWDASLWERTKTTGEAALRRLILEGLERTSVTVVLIGRETYLRPWVRYEIEQSYLRGNGMLGVYLGSIRDHRTGSSEPYGPNPFAYVRVQAFPASFSFTRSLEQDYRVYDWVHEDGYSNFGAWVETAATRAGR